MRDKICVYEKFGFCRNGASCKFTHPTLVCDDEDCNIKECSKRHPQACRFFTNYASCKFGESCKFLHRKKPDDRVSKEEYTTLKDKYDTVVRNCKQIEEKYSSLQNRVSSLEANFFDLMRNEIHRIQHDVTSSNNMQSTMNTNGLASHEVNESDMDVLEESTSNRQFEKRKADIADDGLNVEDKKNKICDETPVSDDNMEDDSIVNSIWHEMIDHEYEITKYLAHEIGDIKDNLKGRIIDVTLEKLNSVKDSIIIKRNELINLNGKHGSEESDNESIDTYEMMNNVVNMVEYFEKLPRKKFRNVADKDLQKILEQINIVNSNKQSNLHLFFDGPKSFVES